VLYQHIPKLCGRLVLVYVGLEGGEKIYVELKRYGVGFVEGFM